MSDGATQVGVARARAGLVGPRPDETAVLAALDEVMDPELPMLSIVELGMVGRIVIEADGIRVEILPTFVGCPAIELIRSAVERRLDALGQPVHVVTTFAPPWSSERITPAGRAALAAAGIAPPTPVGEVRCPLCGSARVVIDNVFGPTPCRSLFYCRDCRQPFEAVKPI